MLDEVTIMLDEDEWITLGATVSLHSYSDHEQLK